MTKRQDPLIAAARHLAQQNRRVTPQTPMVPTQQVRPITPAPLARPTTPLPPVGDGGVDAGYWRGYSTVDPRGRRPDIHRPIYQVPTMEREPDSDPPNRPAWVNTNCPPWICPPFWAIAVDSLPIEACVPAYELSILLLPVINMPQDYMFVIRNVAWEVHNAVVNDVFEFDFLINGNTAIKVEDMFMQATPSPAHQNALATTLRMMPTHIVVDRNHALSIRATLRGPINLAGLSPYFPGQPIVTGDCHMRVYLNGWWANMRENLDGGPRPTDLGDAGNITLEDDQSRGAYP